MCAAYHSSFVGHPRKAQAASFVIHAADEANLSLALFNGLVVSNDQWGCKACSEKRIDDLVKSVLPQERELKQLSAAQTELVRKVSEPGAANNGLAQHLHERMDGLPEVCVQASSRKRNLLFLGWKSNMNPIRVRDGCGREVR